MTVYTLFEKKNIKFVVTYGEVQARKRTTSMRTNTFFPSYLVLVTLSGMANIRSNEGLVFYGGRLVLFLKIFSTRKLNIFRISNLTTFLLMIVKVWNNLWPTLESLVSPVRFNFKRHQILNRLLCGMC